MYCPGHARVMGNDQVDWRGLLWVYCTGHTRVMGNDQVDWRGLLWMYCPGHDRVMGNDKVDWRGLHWMYCSGHVRVVGNDRAGKTGEDYFGYAALGTSESWEMNKQVRLARTTLDALRWARQSHGK